MRWTEPRELKDYKYAIRGIGLYLIGRPSVKGTKLKGNGVKDDYLLENWPDGITPLYVGNSLSRSSGMRGRLSSHARGRGNTLIKEALAKKERLYYIQLVGETAAEYEALFIQLRTQAQFLGNIRNEVDRSAARRYAKIRQGMTQFERDLYDSDAIDPRDG